MPDTVIVTAGGTGEGSGSLWNTLIPIGGLIVLAYLVYSYLMGNQAGDGSSGSSGGGLTDLTVNNPPGSSGSSNQNQNPPGTGGGGTGAGSGTTQKNLPGSSTLTNLIKGAGSYIDSVTGKVTQGTGIGNLFVNTGPGTGMDFPLGPVVTTSQTLDTSEQKEVLTNLENSGIANAWWNAVPAPATPAPATPAPATPAPATPAPVTAPTPAATSPVVAASQILAMAGPNPPAQAVQAPVASNPVGNAIAGVESWISSLPVGLGW